MELGCVVRIALGLRQFDQQGLGILAAPSPIAWRETVIWHRTGGAD